MARKSKSKPDPSLVTTLPSKITPTIVAFVKRRVSSDGFAELYAEFGRVYKVGEQDRSTAKFSPRQRKAIHEVIDLAFDFIENNPEAADATWSEPAEEPDAQSSATNGIAA